MRLNKFIAHNSKFSRREADKLIFEGRVKINGKTVETPAVEVTDKMKISINGKAVYKKSEYTVVVYNKPKGELVTTSDPRGRKTIYHSLGGNFKGYTPVGRLDYASEGVLILSNAIDIVDKLMKSDLERVYKIKVSGRVGENVIEAMEKGLQIRGSNLGAFEGTEIRDMDIEPFKWFDIAKSNKNYSILKVAITEGKNRELRRFFAHFNLEVLDLKRVSYGWVNLNALPTGKRRFFSKEEYDELRNFLKSDEKKKRKERESEKSIEVD
ncbi:pseudouridine synthase family protein [Thiovulum sp. ES]|nr:pseudouridine synthase family protein [Thiovulum sp. ES]